MCCSYVFGVRFPVNKRRLSLVRPVRKREALSLSCTKMSQLFEMSRNHCQDNATANKNNANKDGRTCLLPYSPAYTRTYVRTNDSQLYPVVDMINHRQPGGLRTSSSCGLSAAVKSFEISPTIK